MNATTSSTQDQKCRTARKGEASREPKGENGSRVRRNKAYDLSTFESVDVWTLRTARRIRDRRRELRHNTDDLDLLVADLEEALDGYGFTGNKSTKHKRHGRDLGGGW